MKITQIILTSILLFVFSAGQMGCEIEDNNNADQQEFVRKSILPLATGNEWHYSSKITTEDSTTSFSFGTHTSTTLPNNLVFWSLYQEFNESSMRTVLENEFVSTGFALSAVAENLVSTTLFRPYPFDTDNSWNIKKEIIFPGTMGSWVFIETGTTEVTGISMNTQVTTPAGTFDCVIYHYAYIPFVDQEFIDVFEYFAPGVGLVAIGYSPARAESSIDLPTFGDPTWDWTTLDSYHLE